MGREAQEGFPTTDWSLLSRVRRSQSSPAGAPLAELLDRYAPAIRGYLLRVRRIDRDLVDDLTQSFVADKFLTHTLLDAADRGRGRFRNLLVRALENYLISRFRRDQSRGARPVGGEQQLESITACSSPEPVHEFEREWARAVLQEAVERTFDHYRRRRRDDLWEVLRCRVVDPAADGTAVPSYRELVERFGFATPSEASNALITAKRTFMRKLTEVLLEHAGPGADAAEELADLKKIISRPAGSRPSARM